MANDNLMARQYAGAMSISANFIASPRVKRATDLARAVLRATLDLALPRLCASCREPVEGRGLCPACWSKLSFIARPYCERLGIPFAYDPGPGILSMEAIADPPAYNRARAAVRFGEISRALVHSLKYGDRLDLAPMMGRWMSHAGRELLAEADALIPVPLHWRRQWARRFNQSAMLAAAISAESRVPIAAGMLKRVKATAQQVGLTRTERASNVQGAFRVPEESKALVSNGRFVLVDDVLTSGATVEGCARALNRAGAANVDVLIFARVADPVRTSI
jgi:ComF family protein